MTQEFTTEEQIAADRAARKEACERELDAVLSKHEYALIAQDSIGQLTKINVAISFVDQKKYPQAQVAQAE